ncbi:MULTISPECIES: hypothetical protein [Bradyrhizobium]|uniref:Uncharacterized protein n=1 Tax=Bradyrhizobium frederickii TaxID=2560054 RepID=A0A4Y9KNR4_9BRAD|nr:MULTISPECIES: hypothetical protein [Bradyrhizobium]TFV28597.1 hypothetical protein E4K66_38965 [Bradyrhizobium frederickii]TFV67372.1 hypothetical protein E4K64_38605 [Bradyrhizobium frederickii]
MHHIRPTRPLSQYTAPVKTEPDETYYDTTISSSVDRAQASLSPAPNSSSGQSVLERFEGAEFIYPADIAHQGNTHKLSLKQASAARQLLYHPGDVLRREIAKAAGPLVRILMKLTDAELSTLSTRLVSPGCLLADKSPNVLLEILERLIDDARHEAGRASATDRTAFISFLGDLGTFYADSKKSDGPFSLSTEQKQTFLGRLSDLIAEEKLTAISDEVLKRVAKVSAGTGVVGPKKKAERKKIDTSSIRRGLYNLGDEIDERLGVPEHTRIPPITWKPMLIKATRLLNLEEPLVGHMSGSPAEILMVWDMLCGRAEGVYTAALDAHRNAINAGIGSAEPKDHFSAEEWAARLARLAGACAMQIGVGYHSAVEVAESALKYTGQDLRSVLADPATEDATRLLGAGAATDLITELFETQTKSTLDCSDVLALPPRFIQS